MSELKPCPFCGGNARHMIAVGEYWVVCDKCQASCEMTSSQKSATELWSTRNDWWISVYESLPNQFNNVLCCINVNNSKEKKVIIAQRNGFQWSTRDGGFYCVDVTHWRPLPACPTTEDVL